jgi:hypothetical protein
MRKFTTGQLREILDRHQKWLSEDDGGKRADLSEGNLHNTDLSGAELAFANLSGAYLVNANLSGAKLRCTDLSGADLRGANLRGAVLDRTNLSGARLLNADLCNATLYRANLFNAIMHGADLRGARIDFLCWPLAWHGVRAKVDDRFVYQLAYRLGRQDCESCSDEVKEWLRSIPEFIRDGFSKIRDDHGYGFYEEE